MGLFCFRCPTFAILNMMIKKIQYILIALFLIVPTFTSAQEGTLVADVDVFEKARVLEVVDNGESTVPGLGITAHSQTLTIEVQSGADSGKQITFKNDFTQLKKGDTFYARHMSNHLDDTDVWSVSDPYRLPVLLWLTVLFVVLVFVFGGIQGVRGLASLIGSFVLIFYVLVPQIYHGVDAVLVSIGVSSLIIILGSYITHGTNRTTSSAVIGMIVTVIITGALAYIAVHTAKLSGYSSEESTFLNLDTKGAINMVGLLLGGIMIGLLGVLYDIAIGQAIAIEELFRAGTHLSKKQVYERGIRIGREHIGALVNTLAIAYVGASLPLLLLIQSSTTGLAFMLNSEILSTEIIRILIGSIGLILAVPITTYISVRMLHGRVSGTSTHQHHHH